MKVRRIELSEDYPLISKWWERRGEVPPPESVLPSVGVLAVNGDEAIACAFLYEDRGGRIAMVEWEATNPDCTSCFVRVRALNYIFGFFEEYCASRRVSAVLSWVAFGRGDGRILERRKWKKCPGERHELMAFSTQGVT
jgi:hypothetical protein